ncbi:alpha/beta hydrolase family protein [Bailinhaonella thermotolerans]|uniref:Alpha/beta fold hydrolase n=1 Tax=Bailinhaonella thermotolerans TaxID=1070861 RepID=A0A3A4BKL0_9ACTN|nr:alpha/beta fold hydrolase [Bailinhaonella thermotolerans]RJL35874.1 alpha/beta fold hydrolase [Bailinhaonella thermotolerans]
MRFARTATALLLTAGALTTATPGQAAAYPCDENCQAALQRQQANALPRTSFYDAPDPLPWAPAGTLIREQATDDYATGGRPLPATRVLYHSRDAHGRDLAASGVILVPGGRPPKGGWPVVVNAHGTSGIGRDCAPSLMRDLYHGDQMARFLDSGYAVVAPDYAGLGTDGRHKLMDRTAATHDVINAVRSARQAVPGLSHRWVLWGHSQGGAAALSVAERQVHSPEPGYLGAVVTSPGADLPAIVEYVAAQPGMGAFVSLIAASAKLADPRLPLDRVLSPQAMDRLAVTRSGCLGVASAVYAGLAGDTLVRPGYLDEPRFARYLRHNITGARRVAGPVLLLQGEADTLITPAMTEAVARTLRENGSRVDHRTYPGLGHDTYPGYITGIDDGAMPDILTWIANRFATPR